MRSQAQTSSTRCRGSTGGVARRPWKRPRSRTTTGTPWLPTLDTPLSEDPRKQTPPPEQTPDIPRDFHHMAGQSGARPHYSTRRAPYARPQAHIGGAWGAWGCGFCCAFASLCRPCGGNPADLLESVLGVESVLSDPAIICTYAPYIYTRTCIRCT